MTDSLPLVLTVDEVAAALRVRKWAIYDMVKRGDLHAIHVGRKIRIPRSELDRLLTGGQR